MTCWSWLLLLAACGSRPDACERTAHHAKSLLQVFGPAADNVANPRDEMHAVVLARCTTDRWTDAARACFLAANSMAELAACRTKLTAAQAAALSADFEKLVNAELLRQRDLGSAIGKVEKERQNGSKVDLTPGTAYEIDPPSLVLQIPLQGDVVVDGKVVLDSDIDNLFRAAFARDKNTKVVLQADRGVQHGRVVNLMERAKSSGLTRLAIGTSGADAP